MTSMTDFPRTDEQVKADVVSELRWDTRLDASKIQVLVDDGAVMLTGTVPTLSAVGAASTDAWSVLGVTRVDNQVTVELPEVPTAPGDGTICSNAESTLEWNPDIDSGTIQVAVSAGVITLTGSVPTHWEKERAEEVVSGLRGVVSVTNELAVVPTTSFSDEAIAQDVVAALGRSVLVEAGQVDVTVSGGVVRLKGSVPSAAARNAAYRAASRSAGVLNVLNDLVVSP